MKDHRVEMAEKADEEFLDDLANELQTQDNMATGNPVWILQQKTRVYGVDPDWSTPDGWTLTDGDSDLATSETDPGEEPPEGWHWETTSEADGLVLVDLDGEERAEALKDSAGSLPDGWDWRPFREEWVDVQGVLALTRKGIDHHLSINRHNYHGDVRVWVASMFRCEEMKRVRRILMQKGLDGGLTEAQ